jgi:hypothetical protein
MDALSNNSSSVTREPRRDLLRNSRGDLLKAIADGTIVLKRLDPTKLHSAQISPAARAARDSGTAPAATGDINVTLLKAAAQRRLGRPFG